MDGTKMALAIGGVESKVEGMGTVNFKVPGSPKLFTLHNVMYSPNLRRNLLSMSKIDDVGGYFQGKEGKMWVYNKNDEKLFYANKINGLYILKLNSFNNEVEKNEDCQNLNTTKKELANPSTKKASNVHKNRKTSDCKNSENDREKVKTTSIGKEDINIWHKRFCHANVDYLVRTSTNDSVRGLPKLNKNFKECIPCKLAKTKRKSFKSTGQIRSSKPLQLLHMDLCGPLPEKAYDGRSYFLTITDDYSRKVTVFPLFNKSDVFDTFVRYKNRVENFLDLKIKAIRTDSGLEFCHRQFSKFLSGYGIKHERTNFYTPEQNGTSERYNLTVLDGIKAMLNDSKQPNQFWSEAVLCFTYAWNRICHKGQSKTPFELFSGNKPSVKHLRPFGCRAYVGIPKQKRHKLEMRAKVGVMMGYAQQTKGYRIWLDDEQKIVETINVTFTETESSGGCILGPTQDTLVIKRHDTEESSDEEVESEKPALKHCSELNWSREVTTRPDGSRVDVYYRLEDRPAKFKTLKEIENYCKKNKIIFAKELFDFSAKNKQEGIVVQLSDIDLTLNDQNFEVQNVQLKIPENFKEAMNSPLKSKWQDAMDTEMSVIQERKVWDLVPPPKDMKILGNRWVYTIKENDNGEVIRYKARLVAKGFNQIHGETYDEVFSPVVSFTLVRLFFTILVCLMSWSHCQLDIRNAYLYAKLSYRIFMRQPQGYQDEDKKDYVCRLKRSLYGLHQSGRDWYFELDSELRALGFEKLKWSNCVYVYGSNVLLLVYVDDIIVFGRNQNDVDLVVNKLQAIFDIKILGRTVKLLGIEFESKGNDLYLHQEKYIKDICQRFSEYTHTISSLPIAKGQIVSKQDCPNTEPDQLKMSKIPYRSLLGCLSFLASRTRPDICFTVNLLSQYQENPGEKHWKSLLRLLGYVKYMHQYRLKLRKENSFTVNCFSDADFATNRDDRVSIGGMFLQLGNSPIAWRTFKQKSVSLSTMEAEYISLSEAAKEVIWISRILQESSKLGISIDQTNLFCDNKSAIDFANSPVENNRTKHIDIRYHFLRHHVYNEDFNLMYVPSNDNLADIFTKPLSKNYLLKFVNLVFNI